MTERMTLQQYQEHLARDYGAMPDSQFEKAVASIKPTEHQIQSAILERLSLLKGGFFWRQNSGMAKAEYKGKTRFWRAGIAGIGDIMGVYNGRSIAIEVKRPGKKQSDDQIEFQRRFEECGGVYIVCSSPVTVVHQLQAKM